MKFPFDAWLSHHIGSAEGLLASLYAPSDERPAIAGDLDDPYAMGFYLDLARGMGQPAACTGAVEPSPTARPEALRLHAWHALAHGAGMAPGEPIIGSLDGLPSIRDERSQMEQLAARPIEAPVAILFDEDDLNALDLDPVSEGFSYLRHLFVYHRALARLGIQAEILLPDADLRAYKLVIAPSAYRVEDALAKKLNGFTRWGGVVLLGARSGVKPPADSRAEQPQPGLFRYLVGSTVTAWNALSAGVGYDIESVIPGLNGPAIIWAEALKEPLGACGAEPGLSQIYRCLARYTSGPFEGRAALGAHAFGLGQALYMGWYPTLPQAEALVAYLAAESSVSTVPGLPEGVVAACRGEAVLLLNFTESMQTLEVNAVVVQVKPYDFVIV